MIFPSTYFTFSAPECQWFGRKSAWTVIASPERYNSGRKETAEKEDAEEAQAFRILSIQVSRKSSPARPLWQMESHRNCLYMVSAAIVRFVSTV
jgi:hypothetical protein